MDLIVLQNLGIALCLGLLVGLQRESVASPLGGIRTFTLVTLLGAIMALLSQDQAPWWPALGLVSLAVVIATQTRLQPSKGTGLTTAAAMLVMYALGALIMSGDRETSIALGVVVAFLLYLKEQLHSAVSRLGGDDIRAILQFSVLAFIGLPLLPDQFVGPFNAINPHHVGLMVVLIIGINVAGYIAYQFAGRTAGTVLSGFLGGLISSTATTVSYARRAAENRELTRLSAAVVTLASAVMYFRLAALVVSLAPSAALAMALPLALIGLVCLAFGILLWRNSNRTQQELPKRGNPTELKSAFVFSLTYALVLLAAAALRAEESNTGLQILAFVSGLTDVDAITLSTVQLVNQQTLSQHDGLVLLLIASSANLFFKGGAMLVLGSRALLAQVGPVYLGLVVIAAGMVWLW